MTEEDEHKCLNTFISISSICELFKKEGYTEQDLMEETKELSDDIRNLILMKYRNESDEKIKKIIYEQMEKGEKE